MTDYKTTLKSNIQSVELDKKKVKVTCHNAKAGNLVITTFSQNIALFGGHNFDIDKGIDGAKDFKVKFDEKDHAKTFADNLNAILNDNSVPVEEGEQSGWENFKEKAGDVFNKVGQTVKGALEQRMSGGEESADPTADPTADPNGAMSGLPPGGGKESSNKKMFIIGGAVLLVIVIALVIWKTKK